MGKGARGTGLSPVTGIAYAQGAPRFPNPVPPQEPHPDEVADLANPVFAAPPPVVPPLNEVPLVREVEVQIGAVAPVVPIPIQAIPHQNEPQGGRIRNWCAII